MDAGGYGLDAPLVVGEFARGEHSGGLSAREQYATLLARGYAGAWGWAASNREHFDGMRAIRDAPAVASVRLPPLLPSQQVDACPPSPPRRGRRAGRKEGPRDYFEGISSDDYLASVFQGRPPVG